jgi:hypothetical protein
MKDPANMMVRTTGSHRNELKRDAHKLAVAAGWRRIRLGRYRKEDCTKKEAVRLVSSMIALEELYDSKTKIKSVILSAGVNVYIDITERE